MPDATVSAPIRRPTSWSWCDAPFGGHRTAAALTAALAATPDPHAADGDGLTPIHMVAESLDDTAAASIAILVAAGADVRAVDGRGRTPLHLAAGMASPDAVRALLVAGADPDAVMDDGTTPLHEVAGACAAPDIGEDRMAWWTDRIVATAALLVAHGAGPVRAAGQWGRTPAHVAAAAGSDASPRFLEIMAGRGDVDTETSLGVTPLAMAVDSPGSARVACARVLLGAGADPRRCPSVLATTAMMAASRGDVEMLIAHVDAGHAGIVAEAVAAHAHHPGMMGVLAAIAAVDQAPNNASTRRPMSSAP